MDFRPQVLVAGRLASDGRLVRDALAEGLGARVLEVEDDDQALATIERMCDLQEDLDLLVRVGSEHAIERYPEAPSPTQFRGCMASAHCHSAPNSNSMTFRWFTAAFAAVMLPSCADYFGGPGPYTTTVISRETWDDVFDEDHPSGGFTIRVEAMAAESATLRLSELAINAGWNATGVDSVDGEFLLGDERAGEFALSGSAAPHSEAALLDIERRAPFLLEICVGLSLQGTGLVEVDVNGVEYRYDIERGGDIEATVAILPEPCE